MNIKSANDSFGKMLANGTVIYRDVGFCESPDPIPPFKQPLLAVYPCHQEIPKGDRGNNMLRINLSGQFGWNPVAYVPENYSRGIVLFVNDPIPEDWTHLIVSGNSFKRIDVDGGSHVVGAVFATVPVPYNMDAYLEFRTQMGNIYSEVVTSSRRLPWQEKMSLIRTVSPPENRPEEKHLFCDLFGDSGSWCYETVTWGNHDATKLQSKKESVHAG